MGSDFSHKVNDAKALKVAQRITQTFPSGTFSASNPSGLCAYLMEYAQLPFDETMRILHSINHSGTDFDTLRLAYALIHYDKPKYAYRLDRTIKAHAKVMEVTADGLQSSSPRINLRLLLVSSQLAGSLVNYQMSLRDAVRLQRKIYSGRSKALSGRSLLEFVGCVAVVTLKGMLVVSVDADPADKKSNKNLCTDRAKADTACNKAVNCATCGRRRAECRLSVRI